jgi:hypothetical protein
MKKLLIIPILLLINSCEHLDKIEVKDEVTGTKYSNQQFIKAKHIIWAVYPITERFNIKGKVAQPYISNHSMDVGTTDYGETGIEFLF